MARHHCNIDDAGTIIDTADGEIVIKFVRSLLYLEPNLALSGLSEGNGDL